VSGHDVRVHVGRDAGNDPHEYVLVAAGRDELLEPLHVIGPVDHHKPDTVPHGQCELVDPFRISVQHDPVLAGSATQRGLIDDHRRRAELLGELVGAASCDGQRAVGGDGAARRKELQQRAHRAPSFH
jgi:hypothetical protein